MNGVNIPLVMLAIILLLATFTDIKEHRIPNALSLGGWIVGIGLMSYFQGFDGFIASLLGLLVGFGLFIPFYMLKGMAAGDVKLMAAVGAFLGPTLGFAAVCGTLISGAVIALFVTLVHGGAMASLRRYGSMVKLIATTGRVIYFKPEEHEAGGKRFPYAAAIMVGTFVGIYWVEKTIPIFVS